MNRIGPIVPHRLEIVGFEQTQRLQQVRPLIPDAAFVDGMAAIIDRVEVKPISELSPRDIERENPEFRTQDDVIGLLSRVYGDLITPTHTVTVIYFSRIDE